MQQPPVVAPQFNINGLSAPQIDLVLQGITAKISELQNLALAIQQQAQGQYEAMQEQAAKAAEAKAKANADASGKGSGKTGKKA